MSEDLKIAVIGPGAEWLEYVRTAEGRIKLRDMCKKFDYLNIGDLISKTTPEELQNFIIGDKMNSNYPPELREMIEKQKEYERENLEVKRQKHRDHIAKKHYGKYRIKRKRLNKISSSSRKNNR